MRFSATGNPIAASHGLLFRTKRCHRHLGSPKHRQARDAGAHQIAAYDCDPRPIARPRAPRLKSTRRLWHPHVRLGSSCRVAIRCRHVARWRSRDRRNAPIHLRSPSTPPLDDRARSRQWHCSTDLVARPSPGTPAPTACLARLRARRSTRQAISARRTSVFDPAWRPSRPPRRSRHLGRCPPRQARFAG